MQELSDKMLLFIEEYSKSQNATRAAIAAGYSEKTARSRACQLMADPRIKKEMEKRRSDFRKNTDITIEWRLEQLRAIAEKGQETSPSGSYQNLSAANRAIEIMNDMLGTGGEKKATPIKVVIGYEDASIDEDEDEDEEENSEDE